MQSYRNQGNSSSFVIDEQHVRFLIFLVCVFLRNLKGTYWDSRMIRSRLASYSSRAAIRPSRMTSVAGATRSVSTTRRLLTAAYGVAKSTTPSPKKNKTKQNAIASVTRSFFPLQQRSFESLIVVVLLHYCLRSFEQLSEFDRWACMFSWFIRRVLFLDYADWKAPFWFFKLHSWRWFGNICFIAVDLEEFNTMLIAKVAFLRSLMGFLSFANISFEFDQDPSVKFIRF